jgi:hypothetical protein
VSDMETEDRFPWLSIILVGLTLGLCALVVGLAGCDANGCTAIVPSHLEACREMCSPHGVEMATATECKCQAVKP